MSSQGKSSLKQRIAEEMTADYSNALEKNFDLAKQFVRITKDGKVEVLVKEKVSGVEQILLYLIGKLYAKEVGYIPTNDTGNVELMNELGIPKGSLLPWQKILRDEKKITKVKKGKHVNHSIASNVVERVLKSIDVKLRKKS